MRAAVVSEYGPPEAVTVQDVPAPELGPGQARVEVHAAAVNFPDVLLVANEYQVSMPPPFIVGSEYAGVVAEVAPDVTALAVGDQVFGAGMIGAFAEEVVGNASGLTRVPPNVELREAAAFGVAHRTAQYALGGPGRLQPGDEVIVLGAGGGVGLAAVQIAAALGATVTAVASTDEKLEVARAQGATRTVNHSAGDLRGALKETLPGGADIVIDPVGGALSEPTFRSMRYGGRFVVVGFAAGEIPRIPLNLVLLKSASVTGFELYSFMTNDTELLLRLDAQLLDLLAARRVVPHIGAAFPLDDAAGALRHVADGRAIGKVVVDVR